jgi:hypothetical protein
MDAPTTAAAPTRERMVRRPRAEPRPPTEAVLAEKIEELRGFLTVNLEEVTTPRSQRLQALPQHPPTIVMPGAAVKRCQGCKGYISTQDKMRTRQMLFSQMGWVTFQNQQGQRVDKFGKAYMHLKSKCLTDFQASNQLWDIVMPNDVICKVGEDEARVLDEKGYLLYILANKI